MANNRKYFKKSKQKVNEFHSLRDFNNNLEIIGKISDLEKQYIVKKKLRPTIDFASNINDIYKQYHQSKALAESQLVDEHNEYLSCIHTFTYKFIRLLNKDIAPNPGTFSPTLFEKDFKHEAVNFGTKYLANFYTWMDCFKNDENKMPTLFGNPIDDSGYVSKDGNGLPIKDLGTAAAIVLILQIEDPNHSNFGLVPKDDYYQTVLLDLQPFAEPETDSGLMTVNQEEIEDVSQILNVYFCCDANGDEIPALPEILINAGYIHQEIIDTLQEIQSLISTDKLDHLIKTIFKSFPDIGEYISNLIKTNTNQLLKQLNPADIELNPQKKSSKDS